MVMDLLALNNSVEQHVHFNKGAAPGKITLSNNLDKLQSYAKKDGKGASKHVLRTIYLPNDEEPELRNQVEGLHA